MADQNRDIGRLEGLMDGVKETVNRIEGKLDKMNGVVDKHGQKIVRLDEKMKTTVKRSGFFGGALGMVASIVAGFIRGWILGK